MSVRSSTGRRSSRSALVVLLVSLTIALAADPAAAARIRGLPSTVATGSSLEVTVTTGRTEAAQACVLTAPGLRRGFDVDTNEVATLRIALNRHPRKAPGRLALTCPATGKRVLRLVVPREVRATPRRGAVVRSLRVSVRGRASSTPRAPSPDSSADDTLQARLRAISPRVSTWTDAPPVDLSTGRVALFHFWGGCPTCNAEPGYERIQAWADQHPDVRVVAVSCLSSWHEDWFAAHPSWKRPEGFPILVREGGDMDGFRSCIDRLFARYGMYYFYGTMAFLENGQAVSSPDWSADWPTPAFWARMP